MEKRSSAQEMHLVQVEKSLLTSGEAEVKELRLSTPGCVTKHQSKGFSNGGLGTTGMSRKISCQKSWKWQVWWVDPG